MAEQADLALIAEADAIAGCEFLGRFHQRLPARAVEALDQRRLDLRLGLAADAAALQLRRDYLGVVDDELVARLQPLRQVGDDLVAQRAAIDNQHLRGVARARRAQCYALGGQVKIEEIVAHLGLGAVQSLLILRSAERASRRMKAPLLQLGLHGSRRRYAPPHHEG